MGTGAGAGAGAGAAGAGAGWRGAGSGPRVLALLRTQLSAGEVSALCLKNNPKRVAECERACVTSEGAVA